ncbi:hypothetical protein WUBG_06211, partial [Wuchereria bancrofti]
IVSMRKPVEKARVWLCRRLIRQKKLFQKSQKVCRDDVSKFALINLKTLNDLLKKTKISVDERVLYKLACQETVLKSVKEFRIKYPNWQHEVSFLLQRLEKKKKLKDKTKSDESDEISIPVLKLPKLELPKPVITKGQAIIKQLSLDGNQDDDFASISASDRSKDIALQGNVEDNVNSTNGEAIRSIPPVKIKDIRKRKKDFEYDRNEKRADTLRQNNSGAVSSLKSSNK